MNILLQSELGYATNPNPFAQFGPALIIPYLIIVGLMLVSMWKIHEKAGQPGWAIFIPIYNLIIFLKIIKRPSNWIFLYIGAIAFYIIGIVMMMNQSMLGGILLGIGAIAILIITIMDYHRLSLSFGKDAGWTVGLIFLGFIFIPIMALNKSNKYIWTDKGIDEH